MKYIDCEILEGDLPCSDTGHPLSTYDVEGIKQPIVFLRWMLTQDEDSLRIHREWVHVRYPLMLCGNTHCTNPAHMVFGRRSLQGDPTDSAPESQQAFHRQQVKRNNAMDLSDLRKSISEMSDEELEREILGIRKSRREGPTKKRAAAKKRQNKKAVKDVSEELASIFASMSPEEQMEFLTQLEDEDDGDDD